MSAMRGRIGVRSGGMLVLLGLMVLGLQAGCAGKKKTIKTELDDIPGSRAGTVVFSGDPDRGAVAHDAASEELSEAQWEILLRYAPRSTWDTIRRRKKDIQQARKEAVGAKAQGRGDSQGPKVERLPEVEIDDLGDGRIQMYYRLRHYGGVNVTAVDKGDMLERRQITTTPRKADELLALLKVALGKKGSVTLLAEGGVLVITCDASLKMPILRLLGRVDVPSPQVEIVARIFEVDHSMDFQAGVRLLINHMASDGTHALVSKFSAEDFAKTAAGVFPGNIPDPGSALGLMQTFGSSGWSANGTIQALSSTGLIHMVSEPRMTVEAGNTGYMLAGQELPIASARESNDNLITEKTVYKPVGVQLYVTPQVVGADSVKLHILTIVSAVAGFQELTSLDGATSRILNPIFDTREAHTYVTIPRGGSLMIGGLRQSRTIVRENKLPGLGNIPYLGWLFKSHRDQKHITDLYFFVTPRIINSDSGDDGLAFAALAEKAAPLKDDKKPAAKAKPAPKAKPKAKPAPKTKVKTPAKLAPKAKIKAKAKPAPKTKAPVKSAPVVKSPKKPQPKPKTPAETKPVAKKTAA